MHRINLLESITSGHPEVDFEIDNDSIGYTEAFGIPYVDKRKDYYFGTMTLKVKLDKEIDINSLRDGVIEDGLVEWIDYAPGKNVELKTPEVWMEGNELNVSVEFTSYE